MIDFFIPSIILLLIAGLIPLILKGARSRYVSCTFQAGGGILVFIGSVLCLLRLSGGIIGEVTLTPLFPVELGIDRLSAVFTLLLGILTISVSLYTPGYIQRLHDGRSQDVLCALIPLFLGSMLLVLLSRTTFSVLVFWELMAIISFFLVLIEYRDEKARYAAFFYLVMTQISTVCIFFGIICFHLIIGSFAFPRSINGSDFLGILTFCFLFLGISIKSGVIPFHKWLVFAHPAAASPVSALMSGMMLNTALYLLFRIISDFFLPDLLFGLVILSFGCMTAVLGVMYALKEQDLKSLLAYSSIDNTGVIMVGIGLYSVLLATGHPEPGTMGLLGALFHAVSHGIFKGLLFLTSGSVNQATGTRNIDELGGLLVRMPWTGGLFFIGMLSISAIPPFNGFAGELLIYQAFIQGLILSQPTIQVILIIALSLFGLCGALTAVCFVKAFGLVFLALPRTQDAKKAREVPFLMIVGPFILAVICLLSGVFSSQIFGVLGFAGYLPDFLTLSILLICTGVVTYTTVFSFASRKSRISITWGCGMNSPTPRMEYTGSGFTEPVVRFFSPVFRTRLSVSRRFFDSDNCFIRDGAARIDLMKFFLEYLYLPVARIIDSYADKVANFQNGKIDRYVLYVFVMVVFLIIFIGWVQ